MTRLECLELIYIVLLVKSVYFDPELDKMQKALDRRLDDYMQEFNRHPITYNHYLTDCVQALKEGRLRDEVTSRCRQLFNDRGQLTARDIGLIVNAVV